MVPALGTQNEGDTQAPAIWDLLFQMENTTYRYVAAQKQKYARGLTERGWEGTVLEAW